MLALYQADRRADALDVYRRLRQTLVERLGIEPGDTAQRLHRTILAGEDALTAHVEANGTSSGERPSPGPARQALPAQLPATPAGFAGRDRELASLDQLLVGIDQEPRIGMISGMAGVGKSTVALHWAHQVADRFPQRPRRHLRRPGPARPGPGGVAGGAHPLRGARPPPACR